MFHDPIMESASRKADGPDERRRHPRDPAIGELVVEWMTGPGGTHRYRLVDRSIDGFRVEASVPMPTGTTGTIKLVLGDAARDPVAPDDPVAVAWVRPNPAGGFTIGLSRMQL